MIKQQSLAAQTSFEKYGRKSRRELFLDEMGKVVPWPALQALVEPHYAKAGNGRQPLSLRIMLRTYFVQQWFNLSDPGVEEALYEFPACDGSWASTLVSHQRRMRLRCAVSAIYLRSMIFVA